MIRIILFTTMVLGMCAIFGAPAVVGETSREDVARVLDALHDAAAKADGDEYFALFAPDAVFLGTDASERWTIEDFRKYASERFATGTGWTYTLIDGTRHIRFSHDGTTAWFDELLSNAKYGTCRGSGVLQRIGGQWKIAQYNLAFTIPNDLASEVVGLIRSRDTPGATVSGD